MGHSADAHLVFGYKLGNSDDWELAGLEEWTDPSPSWLVLDPDGDVGQIDEAGEISASDWGTAMGERLHRELYGLDVPRAHRPAGDEPSGQPWTWIGEWGDYWSRVERFGAAERAAEGRMEVDGLDVLGLGYHDSSTYFLTTYHLEAGYDGKLVDAPSLMGPGRDLARQVALLDRAMAALEFTPKTGPGFWLVSEYG